MAYVDPVVCPPDVVVGPGSELIPVYEALAGCDVAYKIMIVDDESIHVRVTRKYLERAGYAEFR